MRARRRALAILAVLATDGCGDGPRSSPTERAEAAVLASRVVAGRFGRQTAWQSCTITDTAGVVPRVRCAAPPAPGTRRFDEIEQRVADVRQSLGPDSSAPALHALALVELAWRDSDSAGVTRAVRKLESASRRSPKDAVLLNDLAVAYLTLAERDQQLQPMLWALDAVNRALESDSSLAAALFNRALVLDRLYLVALARGAWSSYVAAETNTDWRAEAEGHAQRLASRVQLAAWPETSAPLLAGDSAAVHDRLRTLVRRSGGNARDFGFVLLGEWGDAIERADSARASRLMSAARTVAAMLDSLRADRSIALTLEEISGSDRGRRVALARAYVRFGEGRELFGRAAFDSAVVALAEAERDLERLGSAAAPWAAYYRAAALVSRADYDAGDAAFRATIAQALPEQPALIGKSMMGLGLSRGRRGQYELAMAWYRRATPYIERAREPDAEGWLAHLRAETLGVAGRPTESDREAYRALRLLSPYRRTNYLNNQLATVASIARTAGAGDAALDVMQEVMDVSRALGKADALALALCGRARDLIASGRPEAAAADLAEAERLANSMSPGRGLQRIRALVELARGEIIRDRDPKRALAVLENAVTALRPFGTDLLLPVALYGAGDAARRSGDPDRARRRLGEAIAELEGQQRTFQTAELRAAFSETVETVFDAMIAVEIDAGRTASAFAYLERARVATWMPGSAGAAARDVADVARRLPADMLLLEYAVLEDRLAVWAVSRDAWRYTSVPVRRDTVRALVERFLGETGLETDRAVDTRARLFDLLVRPVQRELGDVQRVTIVADRELYRVPFGALWDRAAARYAIERHEFRSAPSAGFLVAALSARRSTGAPDAALVVGNPASKGAVERGLPPLPGARIEAQQVARLYRSASLLTDGDAHRGRVLGLLRGASIFHFAGHAVFDADRPERSYLALASSDSTDDGILDSREIARLRLSNVRFVVLSACTTASPRATRTGPVAGLAYSFMRAGAPATVSTLWDVGDEATTELLVAFHRHVAQAVSPSDALRRAQLEALRSASPRRRVPRAWAAFTYTGP
jgi:CHAT domain-containing protein